VISKMVDPTDPASIMSGYQASKMVSCVRSLLISVTQAALFTSCGCVGGSLVLTLLLVRGGQRATAGMMAH
jgi:hypothetical protein